MSKGNLSARVILPVVCLLVCAGSAVAEPWPAGVAIPVEAAGGIVGGLVVWAGAAAATYGAMYAHSSGPATDDDELWLMGPLLVTGLVGYPVGSALGVWGVGAMADQDGEAWGSFAGAGAGLAVGVGVLQLSRLKFLENSADAMNAVWVLAFACPPAGAVVGYNLSRKSGEGYGLLDRRVVPPSVGVKSWSDLEGHTILATDVRLLTVRF
jgi:hypothetical protein